MPAAQGVGEEAAASDPRPPRRSRWPDRIVGIVLGIVLGIGVVTAFLFLGSEGAIDAPRIKGVDTGAPRGSGQGGGGTASRLPIVRVVGGFPPQSGPARLRFAVGRTARFAVVSDQRIAIEIPGYGVTRTVGPGRTTVSFKVAKPGQFPLIGADSTIAIATLRFTRR